jgi:hypothetical protein
VTWKAVQGISVTSILIEEEENKVFVLFMSKNETDDIAEI